MISKASIPLFRKLSLQICSIVHLQPDEEFTPAHSAPTHTHFFHILGVFCACSFVLGVIVWNVDTSTRNVNALKAWQKAFLIFSFKTPHWRFVSTLRCHNESAIIHHLLYHNEDKHHTISCIPSAALLMGSRQQRFLCVCVLVVMTETDVRDNSNENERWNGKLNEVICKL